MRKTMIECRSYATARRRAQWAAVIARVEGGFLAFESYSDYVTWRGQK